MKWKILWAMLVMATIFTIAVALHPEWRVRWQAWLLPEKRDLLASVTGDLLNNGIQMKVLKFATGRGLIIEVHSPTENEASFNLVDRIFIPDRHDGYVTLNSQPTRLAIVDVDHDGSPEILAPSFDEKLVAHLNTLRLNPASKKLELVKPE
jgi:hypothetical protein